MGKLEELQRQLDAERAKNAEKDKQINDLRAATVKGIRFKVSEKGALSVYGIGRFPQTLYRSQWETLLGPADMPDNHGISTDIKAFIRDNSSALKVKDGYKPGAMAPKVVTETKQTPSQELANALNDTGNADLASGSSDEAHS